MRINGTAPIRQTAGRDRAAAAAAGPDSRALTVQEPPSGGRKPLERAGGSPHRRMPAFLAHLALQYDGVADRRRERAERLKTALASYGAEARLRAAPPARHAHDLTI